MLFIKEYCDELSCYVKANRQLFDALNSKKVMITGAAGLIGSYIIDLIVTANREFDTNIKVVAIDRNSELLESRFPAEYSEIKKTILDVSQMDIPDDEVDYCIHAASNTSPIDYAQKPIDTIRTNSIGTYKMLEYCIRNNVKRFMFCSSVEAYGQNNGDVDFFDEKYSGYVDCNTLRAGYPSGKRASEAMCNAFAAEYENFDFVISRIGRIYGPTVIEGDAKAPTMFIRNAINGEDIVLKSDGMQEYSFGYVADCAIAMLIILVKGEQGHAYNIADERIVRLREFAQKCAEAGGTKVIFDKPNAIESAGYSKITKALMKTDKLFNLGWSPKSSLEEGIMNTVKYLKELKEINL